MAAEVAGSAAAAGTSGGGDIAIGDAAVAAVSALAAVGRWDVTSAGIVSYHFLVLVFATLKYMRQMR
jgi:hypothetical protein